MIETLSRISEPGYKKLTKASGTSILYFFIPLYFRINYSPETVALVMEISDL